MPRRVRLELVRELHRARSAIDRALASITSERGHMERSAPGTSAPHQGPPAGDHAPAPAAPRYVPLTLELLAAQTGMILGVDTQVVRKDAIVAIRGLAAR